MHKIKWKPFPKFREDGSYYMVGDFILNKGGDGTAVLERLSRMPKKKPISFQQGYLLLSQFTSNMFSQPEGGTRLANFLNDNGFFPEALTQLGYHIEVKEDDFVVVEE